MYGLQDNAVVDDEADGAAAASETASTFYNENDDESTDTQQQGEYNSSMMKQKMDLNTAWVEMLIRHEQNKKTQRIKETTTIAIGILNKYV